MAEDEAVGTLFPLETVWCVPANLGTADCGEICRADDGIDYAIKDGAKNFYVPHAEWFCTRLAELVNIAAPPCKVVKMATGTLALGSRWEGGVIDRSTWLGRINVDIALSDLAPVLSRIYAFDHFIYNEDRHSGNLLMRSQRDNKVAVLAFDYSRAWVTHGFPLPALPFAPTQNTRKLQRAMTAQYGKYIDPDVCEQLLERLKKVKRSNIEAVIKGHPSDWLSDWYRSAILGWWESRSFNDRIDGIAKGIRDGSYL